MDVAAGINLPPTTTPTGLGVRWNGAVKPLASAVNNGYTISLTSQDLANTALYEVVIFEVRTGATLAKG